MRRSRSFRFRFAAIYRLPALLFGVTSTTAGVWVNEALLRIRFGPWRVQTPRSNVIATLHTGPYSLIKTMGPAQLSFADRGLTCATNSERGLCIRLPDRHPALSRSGCYGIQP